MRCPECGAASRVLETRDAANMTTRRLRACPLGHRFTTFELYATAVDTRGTRRVTAAVLRRIALRERDVFIAKWLHSGWRKLAEMYGLQKASIYLAAKRGRKHTQEAARNADE